jgi:hypothetical protein
MTYDVSADSRTTGMDYQALFDALPGNNVLLKADAPVYTIVAVTPQYLHHTGTTGEALIGKGLFEAFPANAAHPEQSGEREAQASLEQVLLHKAPHDMPVLRYNGKDANGAFTERYWKITNKPVLTPKGEVVYIIHTAEEITAQVVTDRKEASYRNMQRSYDLFMSAPVIIGVLKGKDYIIEMANEGLLEVWGRTNAVVGKPLLQAVPELEAQGFISLLDSVRTTGESFYAYEYPITLVRNGKEEILYFDFIYKAWYDGTPGSKADGVVSVGYDVTAKVLAKREAEEVRREAEKQRRLFETVNGSTPDLIYVFDKSYRFIYANKALLTMWGSTWEAAVGKGLRENGYEDWHAEMHEREIDQVIATKDLVRGQVSFPHATLGKRIYDYIFVPVLDAEGEVESIAGTTRDITELKQAEEQFRNLADESPIFVFIIEADPLAPVNYWNKTWLHYTGQTPEEARGRAWDGIIHPEDVPLVMEHYAPAFAAQTSYFIPAVRVKRFDGTYRWHAFKGNPRYGSHGDFNGYVGVGFDIHEQKLAEEALKQSEESLQEKVAVRTAELEHTVEELKRSNANLEEFAYAASHDLKEPIRKIQVFSDRLKSRLESKLESDDRMFFERMELATRRMSSLIDDLLQYSHISREALLEDQIDLNEKVRLVLVDLDMEIEDKGAVITVEPLPVIKGHRRQMQQLFQNLVGNALKYARPGVAPEVRIRSRRVDGDDLSLPPDRRPGSGSYHLIEVQDNGIGFDQSDADRIFNVFTRLHGLAEYKGTGVGLSIVRKVVENHGGEIWAESSPSNGATFRLLLPA